MRARSWGTSRPEYFPPQLSERFFPYVAIQTDAVLSLDEDTTLSTSEVSLCAPQSPAPRMLSCHHRAGRKRCPLSRIPHAQGQWGGP